MKIDRYFRTKNFYLASFLYAKGAVLTNIDRITDPKRAEFVFAESPSIFVWLEVFNFGKENNPEALIDGRKLIQAIKELKDKLYSSNF
jgi:hypothetical protein